MKNSVTSCAYLAAILLSPLVAAYASEPANCQLKQYGSLDLVHVGNEFYLVPVVVKGSRELMVLNTSEGITSMTPAAAARLGLHPNRLPSGSRVFAGKAKIEQMVTVDGFSVGGVNFKKAEFLVMPDPEILGNRGGQPPIGILGMDVLSHMDVELDFSKKKMNLFSPDHCPGQVVYWSKKWDKVPISVGSLGEFYFPMELEGKKLETTISTGNAVTTLHEDVTKKLFNFDSNSPDVESETDSKGQTHSRYRAMKLSGEGIDIINANITLTDRAIGLNCGLGYRAGVATYEGCWGLHPLVLGRNVLDKLHIYIATKEKVLYFTPADARN